MVDVERNSPLMFVAVSDVWPSERPIFLVIPCGSQKLDVSAPARELYVSSMFRMALAAAQAEAEGTNARILVLSALHGLVELDAVLAPYDVKMGGPGCVDVDTLTAQAERLGMTWGADVYGLLPSSYFDMLDAVLRPLDVYPADVYEATGGIGEQRHVCAVVRDFRPEFEPAA